MFYAFDQNHNRVHIDQTIKDQTYFCPSCGNPLIQKHGFIRSHHFAHAKEYPCSDKWNYDGMTDWHIGWQECYSEECREVVMDKDGVKHRADICVRNTVVEFQHSPISVDEFKERNRFYTSCGKKVIWLFDAREQYRSTLVESEKANHYDWKYAPQTLNEFDFFGDVQIYLHLIDKKVDGYGKVIRVCAGSFKYFKTFEKTIYDESQFLQLTEEGIVQESLMAEDFYHSLYSIRKKNNEVEYFGCPINTDGYAPKIREENRVTCDQCSYCLGYDYQRVKCRGRFRSFLEEFGCMLEQSSISKVWSFTYLNREGKIRKETVFPPPSPAKTIAELWDEYDTKIIGVRNIKTGTKFKINGSPAEMQKKYNNKVYGYVWDTSLNRYKKVTWEIWYASRPEWVVEWFYKRD